MADSGVPPSSLPGASTWPAIAPAPVPAPAPEAPSSPAFSEEFTTRFSGVRRLFATDGLERLHRAHVAVVGLGGVGSWAVEALARSGVGRLTLIDLDEVCLTNVNRQLPALAGTVGRFKAEVLAERVHAIQPECVVSPQIEFFTEATADRLLEPRYDAVVDAIDALSNKARLVAACVHRGIPVVVSGAAGGRVDPTRLRIADLTEATHDRLLAELRRTLRSEAGFPAPGRLFGVPCVYSTEVPRRAECDASGPAEGRTGRRLGCETGLGSACFVTGAFGFAAASWVIRTLAAQRSGGLESA